MRPKKCLEEIPPIFYTYPYRLKTDNDKLSYLKDLYKMGDIDFDIYISLAEMLETEKDILNIDLGLALLGGLL